MTETITLWSHSKNDSLQD